MILIAAVCVRLFRLVTLIGKELRFWLRIIYADCFVSLAMHGDDENGKSHCCD